MERDNQEMLNVLVVDDDEAVRTLLVDIISRAEHQAIPAVSAEQGLELLPVWTFQVAFIDVHLPGMDGIVLGEYLRRSNPDMNIVIITGDSTKRVERRSRNLSLQFLAKPFRVQDIVDVLDRARKAQAECGCPSTVPPGENVRPSFSTYLREMPQYFAMPKVAVRIEDRLVQTVRGCLSELSSQSRYNERDRVFALAGLLTAQVLGLQLPRTNDGSTLFEEYDEIMKARGKATEFE